jgi:hypothetical protein
LALTIGTQLGSLEVTALIGRGGMGEVYRARDTKLKRDVAIKITWGKLTEAKGVLKELEGRYARKESPAMHLAAVYAGLKEKDQAFGWLERDFQARTGLLSFLVLLPDYDTLQDDPRHADLLRRMGLRP